MKKKKIIMIASIGAFFLLAWSPWITTGYAREKIMSRQDFFEVHRDHFPNADLPASEVHVYWLPFMRYVTTYEYGWGINFLGITKPDKETVPFPIGRVTIYVNDIGKSAETIRVFVTSLGGTMVRDLAYEQDNTSGTMQVHILEKEKFQLENVLSKEATDGIVSGSKILSFNKIPKVTKNIAVEIGLVDVKILENEGL